MIAGKPPFFGETRDEVVNLIKKGEVDYKGNTYLA
jgi:hypothetical protein